MASYRYVVADVFTSTPLEGNPVAVFTDARGKITSYTYNPTSGNLTSVTQDGTQVGSYTYDTAGRVATFTDGNQKATTYTYDANGNLASATRPSIRRGE